MGNKKGFAMIKKKISTELDNYVTPPDEKAGSAPEWTLPQLWQALALTGPVSVFFALKIGHAIFIPIKETVTCLECES